MNTKSNIPADMGVKRPSQAQSWAKLDPEKKTVSRKTNVSWLSVGIASSLLLVILAVYGQLWHYDFVALDDMEYVYMNEHVRDGLSWKGLIWAFTTDATANWHPLTWLSLMLDSQLFGIKPGPYHMTNVFFHLANTLLLFGLLRRITKAIWFSAFVAALFALHPLHVESVAWVAERKDVLSTFFWMLTIWFYVLYLDRPGILRYSIMILLFCLGLMAKPMLVTLPFVLLLLDYWPLGRFSRLTEPKTISSHNSTGYTKSLRYKSDAPIRLVVEKIPLFILSMIFCLVTYYVQHGRGAIQHQQLGIRVATAVVSYTKYITKMFWPRGLTPFYPSHGVWTKEQLLGLALALVIITILVILLRRRLPYLLVGWLWYLGTMVPVIGLIQAGSQAMADRYTYIPLIGLFIMIAWGAGDLVGQFRHAYPRIALGILATGVLSIFSVCTYLQVGHWRNDITLWEHTLKVTKDNFVAYNTLAWIMAARADSESYDPERALFMARRAADITKFKRPEILDTLSVGKGPKPEFIKYSGTPED